MQLRLAFSVAAFLEPEILVIDEVLAVGDAEFQKKCIGKMESVSNSGRTILFVSHNMGVISALCKKAVLLNSGSIEMIDDIGKVIHTYLEKSIEVNNKDVTIDVHYSDKENLWTYGSNLILKIGWPGEKFGKGCICDIAFYTHDGVKIFSLQSNRVSQNISYGKGKNKIVFEIENLGFAEKEMRIDVGLKSSPEGKYEMLLENVLSITPSGKNLFSYKANDTLVVPKAKCYYED
jgi:ABC-type methionine transport system ATPase subunit